jgi:SAM-dependent methyltransferase
MPWRRVLKAITPQPLRSRFRAAFPVKRFLCPVCDQRIPEFERLPDYWFDNLERYQYVHSIFAAETANFLHYSCPQCGAADRDRLYALYIKSRLNGQPCSFVDFAPAPALSKLIRSRVTKYRSADLIAEGVDDKVDLTALPYAENSLEAFLCSHVLEHIEDDRKAMSELYRVLKPGGWGIAMVPIQLDLEKTLEGLDLESDAERWKYYGQNDHVRMYSKQDFIARLQSVGFEVKQFGQAHFGEDTFRFHGLHPRSVLYVVEKH